MKQKSETPTSYRLTPEAKRLLQSLAENLGVNRTSVIEMAIRKLAQSEGVK